MTWQRDALRRGAVWRRAAAWGAQSWPEWFARGAPVVIGVFFSCFALRARRAVGRNLKMIRGRTGLFRHQKQIIETFIEFARALTAGLSPERPLFKNRTIDLRGEEHVRPFLDEGRGMLLVTAHVGPWDACALRLRTMMDVPVLMMMSTEASREAQSFHDEVRSSARVDVLRIGEGPLDALPLLGHLERGGAVVAQLDRVLPGARAIHCGLFETEFAVPEGLFRLAAALECPLIPVFSARLDSEVDQVVVSAPVWVPGRPSAEALADAASKVVVRLEEHLRRFPTQWFHFVGE